MPIAAVMSVLFQVYFGVHAIRNGKDRYWLFILFIFPGIGSLIYFIVEFLPDLRHNARLRKTRVPTNPAKRLRYWKDQVEITPSVKNRKHLAEACIHGGRFKEAIALYEGCLEGLHAEDPDLMEGLALAHFFVGAYDRARQQIERLRALQADQKNDEFDLLYARCLEALGDSEGALAAYARLEKSFAGEEARCRYGLLLKKCGRNREAREQFCQVLENARLSQHFYGKAQKKWIAMAKSEL